MLQTDATYDKIYRSTEIQKIKHRASEQARKNISKITFLTGPNFSLTQKHTMQFPQR